MKLFEAMKEVFQETTAWITKENTLQIFALIGCAVVIIVPWIPLFMFLNPLVQGTFLLFWLGMICVALSTVWSLFWVRVFSKWWPF